MRTRISLILLAGCLGAAAPEAKAAPLADRLPAGSLVYVGWAGRSLTFDGSIFGQLLDDPAIGRLFGAIKSAAESDLRREGPRKAFAHAWDMARIAWQHPLAAALIDVQKGPSQPKVSAALLIDLGKDKPAFDKHLQGVFAEMKDDIAFVDATVAAVTYKVHKSRGEPEIAYGYLGSVLFVTVGEGTARTLIELAPGKGLTANKKFAESLQAVGGKDAQLAYYMDVSVLSERAEQIMPAGGGEADGSDPVAQAKKIISALGLAKASAVAGAIRVVDRGLYTKARVFTPAPHQGVLMPLAGSPLTDADLASVPADADVMMAARLSPEAAYAELRRAVKAIDPQADAELGKALGGFEEEIGLSLRRNLLPNLGDTWVLSSAPSRGGFLTGTLLTATVKDEAKLSAALRVIEGKLTPPMEMPERDGPAARRPEGPKIEMLREGRVEIHYLALPSRRMPLPVAPAWAVHNKTFYLAPYPQVIQAAVAPVAGQKLLAQDPAFRKARGRLEGKCSILCYVNTPKVARQVYHWALIGWTLGANALSGETPVTASPGWLPPISRVEKYLWPQACGVSSDAKGITFEAYGSMPSPMLGAGLLVNQLPVWVLIPTVRSAQTSARAARRMSELRMISQALMMYRLDHGKMPASLKDPKLAEYFRSPTITKGIAVGMYSYLPPAGNKAKNLREGRTILVYMPTGPGRPYVVAAFADGHVERQDPRSFERMLKAQLDGTPPGAPAPAKAVRRL